ncbi:E3 ubiquitin-protein ligase PUB23-like [Iris pallida]|uniref:U-box domain-containing protein n=1 Tax=Iris pallida TaxID=29817 RepID=A0AAX6H1K9_IRIPA|nr:E3 ubiquitin-protein ligase PUB23-like [Iris pallida]
MEGIEVPSFFLCPISFQIMRDPVTLPTGITYDRHSIDRWLFTDNHDTCPITKVPLTGRDRDLITPNHTLRRLIQAWCVANASVPDGIERFPTPRPPVDRAHVAKLIDEARSHPQQPLLLLASLQKLKSIVGESDRNRSCVESSGAVDFLASVVEINSTDMQEEEAAAAAAVVDEALGILHSLQVSEQRLVDLVGSRGDFVDTLTAVLQHSSYQSRAYASLMLKSLLPVLSSAQIMGLKEQLFVEMVKVLKDRISYQATKAALRVLSTTIPWGRNKVKAVEAGAVPVLIDLLLDETEKKGCEMTLVVLSRLSECAEGRAEVVGHAAGIAVVSKKLVRVSIVATERAVRIVHSVAKFSPTSKVLKEMLEFGVVSKLCLLVQVDCGKKTKDRVKEILRLHSRVWRNSPCISPQLHTSYPA